MNSTINQTGHQSTGSRSLLHDYSLDRIWIDGQDIMQQLHISHSTLWRLRVSGKLAYCKLGRKIFYKKADIERMLERAKTAEKY